MNDSCSEATQERIRVSINELSAHPDNPRVDLGDLADMVRSMESVGILEPIVVTPRDAHLAAHPDHELLIGDASYVIIAGHRRAAAAAKAKITEVPIEVRPELSADGQDIEVMAIENLHRLDLNPVEEALLYQQLASAGRSQRQIAKRVGRGQSHVSKRLALLELPETVRAAVAAGKLDVTEALTLSKLDGRDDQLAAYRLMTRHHLDAKTAVMQQRTVLSANAAGATVPTRIAPQGPERQQDGSTGLTVHDRDECCARIASRKPTASAALRRLTDTVLLLEPPVEALSLAHRWLRRAGIGPMVNDPQTYARQVLGSTDRLRIQLACAVALAADEIAAQRCTTWGRREATHIRRLIREAGYQPSDAESRLLDAAEEAIPVESPVGVA